jgi:hypothetical protein
LTVTEFVDELIDDLEDRLEGHFTPREKGKIRHVLADAVIRLDGEKLDA